jgi:CHAD domain-containing protein
MAFGLRPEKQAGEELRRIARRELGRAAASLRRATALSKVHDARKRVKKVRAVVKLMSEADKGSWTKSDKPLQAAGRVLSDVRDADAIIETFDQLRHRYPKRLSAGSYRGLRRELTRRRAQAVKEATRKRRLQSAAKKLEKVRRAAKKWAVPTIKRSELPALLGESFRVAGKAMKTAAQKQQSEAVHDWRKRVKTLWYHMRLIKPLTPDVQGRITRLRSLERLLGEDHNLEVLSVTIGEDQSAEQRTGDAGQLIAIARAQQAAFRRKAFALGKRLHAETNRHFARSLRVA